MSLLHDDLLEQAQHLAGREPRRPRQASLRRAVSTAYYAMFHLLTSEASRLVAEPSMRSLVSRTVAHDEMKQVASAFASGSLSPQLQAVGVVSVPDELKVVAKTFVVLQQARHEADYNRDTSFTRDQVKKLVQLVSEAFQDWKTVRSQPEARAYLVCLLFGKRLR